MDLYAYQVARAKEVASYIEKNYGEVPRNRGVRFMKLMEPEKIEDPDVGGQMAIYNKYCGKDVIYIHTRCGGDLDKEWSNYVTCGGAEWEEEHRDKFLDAVNDEFDGTYRDTYFEAVVDDEYKIIIEKLQQVMKGETNDQS